MTTIIPNPVIPREAIETGPKIRHFEDRDDPPRPDIQTEERDSVNAVIYNPYTNSILCLNWPRHSLRTLIIGGVEKDEELEAAARREAKEETGYTDLKLLCMAATVTVSFYAKHKGVNRSGGSACLVFILNSDSQEKISDNELALHTPVWVDKDKAITFINREAQQYLVRQAIQYIDIYLNRQAAGA